MRKGWLKRLFSSDHQNSTNAENRPVLSCVVDTDPKFMMQAWVWLVSAKVAGAFEDCDVVVHHVGSAPDALRQATDRFGARLYEVEPFGEGAARYCNKLQSHPPVIATGAAGAILTDVDLFFLTSPIACWDKDLVRAKIVDHPNPPVEMLSQLAGILNIPTLEYDVIPTFRQDDFTHALNCNGGLYAFPMASLEAVASLWRSVSTKCLSQGEVLGKWLHHSDQIGFLMSMVKTDTPFKPLTLKYNFPTHFKPKAYDGVNVEDLKILHYHNKLSPEGRLIPTGHEGVDIYIDRANVVLRAHEHLPEYKTIQSLYATSL